MIFCCRAPEDALGFSALAGALGGATFTSFTGDSSKAMLLRRLEELFWEEKRISSNSNGEIPGSCLGVLSTGFDGTTFSVDCLDDEKNAGTGVAGKAAGGSPLETLGEASGVVTWPKWVGSSVSSASILVSSSGS